MPPVGFKPTMSAGERPQTYALDRAAIGTGRSVLYKFFIFLTTFSGLLWLFIFCFNLIHCIIVYKYFIH
jgi:hypothetical protein